MPTPNSTLQISILGRTYAHAAQSYENDTAFASLIEHAARMGQPKPIKLFAYQLAEPAKFLAALNNGSILIISDIGALCPKPSALSILDSLLVKGVRIFDASQNAFINDQVLMLKSCAQTWAHLEDEIAERDTALAKALERHARDVAEVAANTTASLLKSGVYGATLSAMRSLLNPKAQEMPV